MNIAYPHASCSAVAPHAEAAPLGVCGRNGGRHFTGQQGPLPRRTPLEHATLYALCNGSYSAAGVSAAVQQLQLHVGCNRKEDKRGQML